VTGRLATVEYRSAISDYLDAEVLPYVPDAWVDWDRTKGSQPSKRASLSGSIQSLVRGTTRARSWVGRSLCWSSVGRRSSLLR